MIGSQGKLQKIGHELHKHEVEIARIAETLVSQKETIENLKGELKELKEMVRVIDVRPKSRKEWQG